MVELEDVWMMPPFNCTIPSYDVHCHAFTNTHGDWLRYRHNGWVYFPMQITRPYEKGLRMARFRHFREKALCYEVSIPYHDPEHGNDRWFDEIVSWIGSTESKWNFKIDAGGRFADRLVHFTFSDHVVAVEFKLRWGLQ